MNEEMNGNHWDAPCERWATLLAALPVDLTPSDRLALDHHVAGCASCAAARAEYRRMDSLIRSLPAPAPLPGLPPQLAREWEAADAQFPASLAGTEQALDTAPRRRVLAGAADSRLPAGPSPRRRRFLAWMGAGMAAAVVIAFALVFLSQSRVGLGSQQHVATPAPTQGLSSGTALYLGSDGRLHRISLDGAHNTAGPLLPMSDYITQVQQGNAVSAISPNGRAIAYVTSDDYTNGGDGIAIVKLATGAVKQVSVPAADIFWSPDGSQLAADAYSNMALGSVSLINASSGRVSTIHPTENGSPATVFSIVGWLDASHLVVLAGQAIGGTGVTLPSGPASSTTTLDELSGGASEELDVLDVHSGALRFLNYVNSPASVYVSPDGKVIFVAPSPVDPTGYVVDPVSGQIQPLPHISATFASKVVSLTPTSEEGNNWAQVGTWQPGRHIIALSLAAWGPSAYSQKLVYQPAGVWLLNLDLDTAIQVTSNTYPLAWSADGGALLMSNPPATTEKSGVVSGPLLSVLSPVDSSGASTSLTQNMVVFFGLVSGS